MQTLQYPIIQRVERILKRIPFDDLVAIFTDAETTGGLLVYNTDAIPALPQDLTRIGWRAMVLAALQPTDYGRYDGPVIGLDALDVLFPDVPVHGVNFRALERLPLDANRRVALRHTAWRLAAYLQNVPPSDAEARQRMQRKVLSLRLPTWLAGWPLQGLVALQGDDVLEPDAGVPRAIYNRPGQADDVLTLDSSAAWTVGLEEISLFAADDLGEPLSVIELRPILHRMGALEALAHTCRDLARRCWQAWRASHQTQFREAAYALAAESWLTGDEADDLVAILPEADFHRFIDEGDFRCVFRFPPPPIRASVRVCALEDLLAGKVALPGSTVLAFPALESFLQELGASEVLDLGLVLWKAGRQRALARTFWLLSRDLLNPPKPPEWRRLRVMPEIIGDLARRAALMYSLDDPWGWRQGRYHDLLLGVYDHLDHCLENEERAAPSLLLASYFNALRAWYGCAKSEDVMGVLTRAVEMLEAFHSDAEDLGERRYAELARNLIHVGDLMLHPDQATAAQAASGFRDTPAPGMISALLRDVASGALPVREPSPLLAMFAQAYRVRHEAWRRYHAAVLQQRPQSAMLDELRDRFAGLRRRVHAPLHELRMLEHVLDAEISQIDSLRQAVAGGAVIEVLARSQHIILGTRQTLTFEVTNDGTLAATDFELTLQGHQGLELLGGNIVVALPLLRPGERHRFEFQARALQPALALLFSYHFRDAERRVQRGEKRVLVTAASAPLVSRFRINPFEVGRPVAGAGSAFFGRQDEINRILSRLAAKGGTQPLVLRGPRRIGKSSLLREVEAVLDRPVEEGRALNLAPEGVSAVGNIRPVIASLQRMGGGDEEAFARFLRGLLRDVGQKIGRDSASAEAAFERDRALHGTARAFTEQIDQILRDRSELRLVILLDELDDMFRPETRMIAGQLRSIIETRQRLSWITASTRLVRSAVGTSGSPWFNLLETIEVRAMDWNSAAQLVHQLGGRAGCEWGPDAVAALLEPTGQRPYLVQLLGARVTDALNTAGRDHVEIADVTAAVNRLVDEAATTGSYLGFVWNEATPLGQLILWAVHRASGPVKQLDISRAIRGEAAARSLALDGRAFDRAFDERISWLTDIADVLEMRSGQYSYAYSLVKRLVGGMLERTENFAAQAIQDLSQQLRGSL